MPRKGILYFFLDLALLDGGDAGRSVVYVENPTELRIIDPPLPVPALGDEVSNLHGGWTFNWQSASWQPFEIDRFPKFDLAFLPFDDILLPPFEPRIKCTQYEHIESLVRENIRSARAAHYGPDMMALRARRTSTDYDFFALLDRRSLRYQHYEERHDKLSPLFAEWPYCWGAIGLHLASFFDREGFKGHLLDDPQGAFFFDACREWIERAKRTGFYAPLTSSERESYRTWMRETVLTNFLIWKENLNAPDSLRQHIWSNLQDKLPLSALDCASLILGSPHRDALMTQSAQDDFLGLIEVDNNYHQMFGYGIEYQNSLSEHAGKILLLQLGTDYEMLWLFADCGNLQFWIAPQDLAALRFDRVKVSIEGG